MCHGTGFLTCKPTGRLFPTSSVRGCDVSVARPSPTARTKGASRSSLSARSRSRRLYLGSSRMPGCVQPKNREIEYRNIGHKKTYSHAGHPTFSLGKADFPQRHSAVSSASPLRSSSTSSTSPIVTHETHDAVTCSRLRSRSHAEERVHLNNFVYCILADYR